MADNLLSYSNIRLSTASELVQLFRSSSSSSSSLSTEAISHHLLHGVTHGSLQPIHFTTWLQFCKSPAAIHLALTQTDSLAIRQAGIKQLGKNLASARWNETWQGLGGTEGIQALLRGLSVLEVKAFAKVVSRSVKGVDGDLKAEKQQAVFQLARPLLPGFFPSSDSSGGESAAARDERPLAVFLAPLIQACPPDAVADVLARNMARDGGGGVEGDAIAQRRIVQRYPELVSRMIFEAVFEREDNGAQLEAMRPALLALLHGSVSSGPSKSEPGLSVSMQFSLDLLRRLANTATMEEEDCSSNFLPELLIDDLVEPLLRRCRTRKVEWRQVLEIVQLTATYVSRHPDAAAGLSLPPRGHMEDYWYDNSSSSSRANRKLIIRWTARLWSRHPAEFAEPLRALMRAAGVEEGNRYMSSFALEDVVRAQRYAFLRLCCVEVGWGDLDVDADLEQMSFVRWGSTEMDDDVDVRSTVSFSRWDMGSFGWLEPEHAWALFERVRRCVAGFGKRVDVERLRLYLLQRRGEAEQVLRLATRRMDELKAKAVASKAQPDRASHGREALSWASNSGSLTVFKEAVLWSRRFIRDPLTVPELYGYNLFAAEDLLIGNPGGLENAEATVTSLQARVAEANEAIWTLLETITMAMREPAANCTIAISTQRLCHKVVDLRRTVFSTALKKTSRFSEDDIYKIIWEDTLTLLVRAEKAFLEPGPARFMEDNVDGVLEHSPMIKVENASASTYRFFDELAKARDQIWRDFRPSRLPATALLPEPYPRGLAIQNLTGAFRMRASDPDEMTPFIASRARAVVLMDPAKALVPFPEDEAVQAAADGFIDSYQECLEILISDTLAKEERKRRVEEVWAHVMGPLSQERMSSSEAFRYWRGSERFERVEFWPKASENPPPETDLPQHDPRIPRVEKASEVLEWDPLPPSVAPIKEQRLDVTYIDIAKYMHSDFNPSVRTILDVDPPTIPEVPANQLYHTLGKDTTADFEAHAVSALLFLDRKNGTPQTILDSPFPSAEEVRYPALRLHSNFFFKGKKDIYWAFRVLKSHSKTVPPQLLFQLARKSFEEIQSTYTGGIIPYEQEKIAFGLITLLQKSDRPALAVDLAIQAIINFPDASSWHRQLLTPTLLNRLPSSAARACISSFTAAITNGLQAQGQRNSAVAAAAAAIQEEPHPEPESESLLSKSPSPRPPPRVKITTVKHLAQLLQAAAAALPSPFTTAILTKLLRTATHPDIRRAALESLLSMLPSSSPSSPSSSPTSSSSPTNPTATNDGTGAHILAALESDLVPLAGSNIIAAGDPPPDEPPILPPAVGGEVPPPPLLATLLDFIRTHARRRRGPTSPWFVAPLVRRVVLPAVARLRAETGRRVRCFLLDGNFGVAEAVLDYESVPVPPLHPRVWGALLQTVPAQLLPREEVVEVVAWVRANIFSSSLLSSSLAAAVAEDMEKQEKKRSGIARVNEMARRRLKELDDVDDMEEQEDDDDEDDIAREKERWEWWLTLFGNELETAVSASGCVEFLVKRVLLGSGGTAAIAEVPAAGGEDDADEGGSDGGISVALSQQLLIELFDAAIEAVRLWPYGGTLLREFEVPWAEGMEEREAWVVNVRPLVERMLASVGAVRADKTRPKGSVLPDVFGMRLWLLPWPGVTGEEGEEGCKRFADAVGEVLEELCGEGARLYHRRFEQVKKEVLDKVGDKQCRVWVALWIGNVGEGPFTFAERLRVELADELLTSCYSEVDKKEMVGYIEKTIQTWMRAEDEDVRRTAYKLASKSELEWEVTD